MKIKGLDSLIQLEGYTFKNQSILTVAAHVELDRTVPDGAAVRPHIILLNEADGQKTVYHQLTNNRRPEKEGLLLFSTGD